MLEVFNDKIIWGVVDILVYVMVWLLLVVVVSVVIFGVV